MASAALCVWCLSGATMAISLFLQTLSLSWSKSPPPLLNPGIKISSLKVWRNNEHDWIKPGAAVGWSRGLFPTLSSDSSHGIIANNHQESQGAPHPHPWKRRNPLTRQNILGSV